MAPAKQKSMRSAKRNAVSLLTRKDMKYLRWISASCLTVTKSMHSARRNAVSLWLERKSLPKEH